MTAKDIKIRNIMVQRGFIEHQLSHLDEVTEQTGRIDYPFSGEIYPENIKYLNDLGYEVNRTMDAVLELKGRPLYLIYPSDSIVLTDEELEAAKEFKYVQKADDADDADDFLSQIFGGGSRDGGMKQ